MMRTGRIPECGAVAGAGLAMAMTMMTARVRRICCVVRQAPGEGIDGQMRQRNRW